MNISVYLSNLGLFNEGVLNGRWISLPCSDEKFKKACKMIRISTEDHPTEYEEYFFPDHSTDTGLEIGEHISFSYLNKIAKYLKDLAPEEIDIICTLTNTHGFEKAKQIFEDGMYSFYPGCTNMSEVAEMKAKTYQKDIDRLPDWLQNFNFDLCGDALYTQGEWVQAKNGMIRVLHNGCDD